MKCSLLAVVFTTCLSNYEAIPERFERPFEGALTIVGMKQRDIVHACAFAAFMHPNTAGCAIRKGNTCTIFVATDSDRYTVEYIISHETAHCNGWSERHER